MLYDVESEEFETLFKNTDVWGQFRSHLPPYPVILQSLADPSIDPSNISRDTVLHEGHTIGGMNHGAVKDLQTGTRRMLQKIVLPADPSGTFGFLKLDFPALSEVMEFQSLIENMTDQQVFESLGVPQGGPGAGATVAKVAFAVGMTALSAMGPVGAAAAAIIGFGAALINAFRSRKVREDQAEAERLAEAYKYFPDLAEPRSEVDEFTVNNHLMPILQTGDWTPIFSPRFDGDRWSVVERNGGFAMAPGEKLETKNELTGRANEVFSPSGGVGYLPGLNRIMSVIQVSLPEQDPRVGRWRDGGKFPIRPHMVRDVGSFLVNTTRLAAIAWSWVSQKDSSPHLFKVDVQALHDRWQRYCTSGINRIIHSKGTGVPPRDIKDLYAAAIACSVGGWRCNYKDGMYHEFTKGGFLPRELPGIGAFAPNRDDALGCLMRRYEASIKGGRCLTTVYDLRARAVFEQLRARQFDALGRTLLCAYVRRSWAAFRDPELAIRLDQMRGLLLQHPDRMHVQLDDVPPEEMHEGENLRELLIRAGVSKKGTIGSFAAKPTGLEPSDHAAPTVDGDATMPFGGIVAEPYRPPWYRDKRVWGAAGLSVASVGLSYLWGRRKG